jgi:hypothetical protein
MWQIGSSECGGSEIRFILAAGSSSGLPNRNRTGIMGLPVSLESENRKGVAA